MGCEFSDRIRAFKRQMIRELFDQLPDDVKQKFTHLYGDVDKIPEDETYHGYYHCKRYLKRHGGANKSVHADQAIASEICTFCEDPACKNAECENDY